MSLASTIAIFSPGDSSPSQIEKWVDRPGLSRGRRGVYRGMMILAIGIGLLAVTGARDNIFALIAMIAGLLRIFYAMFFQEVVSTKAQTTAHQDHNEPALRSKRQAEDRTNALPPHFVPASTAIPAPDTNELIAVPSVTENTTSLLTDPDDKLPSRTGGTF